MASPRMVFADGGWWWPMASRGDGRRRRLMVMVAGGISSWWLDGLVAPLSLSRDLPNLDRLCRLFKVDSTRSFTMASTTEQEVTRDFGGIRAFNDGTVERLMGTEIVPPSTNPITGVQSKDVVIYPQTGLSARLYLPKTVNPIHKKLPLLVYFHGGAFCIEPAFSPMYHNYLDSLAAEANVVLVSIDYRRAPEHPIPIAYDDSWVAIKWVASHSKVGGDEIWLNDYADFDRLFFAGDSAGGNIAHKMAVRVGLEGLGGVSLVWIVLVHPWFGGKEPIGAEVEKVTKAFFDSLWLFVCPSSSGSDDPLLNPVMDPGFPKLGCNKVLVCVAEKDFLRDRGLYCKEELEKSEWWRLWRLKGKNMCSICINQLVTMPWLCSRDWLLS